MPDGAQPGQQPVQLVVGQGQRIATRQQHVAHFGVRLEIAQGRFPVAGGEAVFAAGIAHHPRTGAIAAIGRAGASGQEQHPVGIAVHQAGNHSVMVLTQRVVRLAGREEIFPAGGDVGAPQRLGGVFQIHQAGVIGRNPKRQGAGVAADGAALVFGQGEQTRQIFQGANAGPHLPAPVVPFRRRGLGKKAAVEGAAGWRDGENLHRLLRRRFHRRRLGDVKSGIARGLETHRPGTLS